MHRSVHVQTFCLTFVTCSLIGCGAALPTDNPDGGGSNTTPWPLQVLSDRPDLPPTDGQFTEAEPNDNFDQANILNNVGYTELNGTIPASADPVDLDVFRLNGGPAGTRVQASLTIRAGSDLVLGLLDEQRRLLAYADPNSTVNGPRVIDLVLREPTADLIAVVAARSSSGIDRPYSLRVDVPAPTEIPAYQPQILVLNFDGADSVKIGRRAPVYVPPFDAAAINPAYAGQTETIISLIVEYAREDYAGLGIAVYASGDPNIPAGGVTTVHFGTYDAALLGLADSIDPYNTLTSQNAIIYTDTFQLFNVLNPSLSELAQVLANVASHEAGHLLGLRHTQDVHDIMDITASARQMLADQWFRLAYTHAMVLPIGYQDSPALLEWTLGGVLIGPPAGKVAQLQRQAATVHDPNDFYIPRSLLGTCGHDEHPAEEGPAGPSADGA